MALKTRRKVTCLRRKIYFISIIAASFLATLLLTVGSYKTEVLNKFGDGIKITLQSLLKIASLILGLITANVFLNSIFPKDHPFG